MFEVLMERDLTTDGQQMQPPMVNHLWFNPTMESKKLLAQTLRRLMEETPDLGSRPKVGSKARIGQSSVGRMLGGEVAATLDSLDRIAKAFKKQPWELIQPDSSWSEERPLMEDELSLLEVYRSASPQAQDDIIALVEAHAARHQTKKTSKPKTVKRDTQSMDISGATSLGKQEAESMIAAALDQTKKELIKSGKNSAVQGGRLKGTK